MDNAPALHLRDKRTKILRHAYELDVLAADFLHEQFRQEALKLLAASTILHEIGDMLDKDIDYLTKAAKEDEALGGTP